MPECQQLPIELYLAPDGCFRCAACGVKGVLDTWKGHIGKGDTLEITCSVCEAAYSLGTDEAKGFSWHNTQWLQDHYPEWVMRHRDTATPIDMPALTPQECDLIEQYQTRFAEEHEEPKMPEVFFKHEDVGGRVLDHVDIHRHANHSELVFQFEDGTSARIPIHDYYAPSFDLPPGRKPKGVTITRPIKITGCEPEEENNGSKKTTLPAQDNS